ncbi:MAG: helix-turn-helix domain-containing protein [Actinomycetota bacterium]|nr:helix-turn-helix domain-containing protein [Actinomycetota bacterium]
MNNPLHPGVSLARILSVLGPSLLDSRWLPPGSGGDVLDIVIWDAVDEPSVAQGDLVLGVGIREAKEHWDLVRRLAGTGCAGLVLKGTGGRQEPLDDVVVAAADAAGVPLVQLTNGASWEQIVVMIRSLIISGTPRSEDQATGTKTDLFALAEVVSAMLGAPVTIEDRSSRVLAFSENQSDVDEARAETVLGRQVPERLIQALSDRGIFRRLAQDTRPVFIEGLYDGMKARTAVSVRAGQDVLGSIWVATDERLSAEREQWLMDAARLVAFHLLRLRSVSDMRQRTRSDHLSTLLQGGHAALEMARWLGLGAGPCCVVAATTHRTESVLAEVELQRLETSLSVHLKAVRPRSAVARVHDVVYAVLAPLDELDETGRGPAALMQDFIDYTDPSGAYLVGIGRPTRSFADIGRSRTDADKTLRVLQNDPRGRKVSVARFVDVQVDSLLLRLVDLVEEDEDMAFGPLAALAAYDQRHHANMLETLMAFLDSFGDVPLAAKSVHVHANTFRYRLRRLSVISGIDLESPETRFGVMLRLRIWKLAQHGEGRR